MNVDDQFLGQTYLGSTFPSGTKAEKEGTRRGSSHWVFLPSCPPAWIERLVGEEAGEGLPQVADCLSLGLIFTWGSSMGGI